jgi:hypothetical protein
MTFMTVFREYVCDLLTFICNLKYHLDGIKEGIVWWKGTGHRGPPLQLL